MILLILLLAVVRLSAGQAVCNSLRPIAQQYRSPPYTQSSDGLVPIQYVSVVPDSELSRSIDNVCLTYFNVASLPGYKLGYFSVTYCDGSNRIFSFLTYLNSSGIYFNSPKCSFSSYILESGPGDSDIYCSCSVSDGCRDELCLHIYDLVVVTTTYERLTLNHLSQLLDIIQRNGLDCDDMIALPMNLPPNCVTEQQCSVNNTDCNDGVFNYGTSVNSNTNYRCNSCT